MTYSVGIIGLGNIGIGYDLYLDSSDFVISHARAFSQNKNFSLSFGVDCDQNRRELFAEEYNKNAYKNIKEALEGSYPDIIVISNSSSNHLEAVLEVVEKYKPIAILCEKPMGSSLLDANKIVKICNDCNIRLYVNYLRISDDGINLIKNKLDNNVIEQPVRGIVWYSKGWIHSASHFYNMLEYWLGKFNHYRVLGKPHTDDDKEKNILVNVSYDRGDITFLYHPNLNVEHYRVEIHALNGQLIYGDGLNNIRWTPVSKSGLALKEKYNFDIYQEIQINRNKCQLKVVEEMFKSLQNIKSNICSGEQALTTLKVMYEIMEKT